MILRKIKSPQQKFKWLNTEFPWAFPMSLGKWQCGQSLSILSFLELPDLANKKTGQKKASKQRERRAWPRLCFRWIINNSYMTVPKVLHGTCSAIWNAAITQLFFFFFLSDTITPFLSSPGTFIAFCHSETTPFLFSPGTFTAFCHSETWLIPVFKITLCTKLLLPLNLRQTLEELHSGGFRITE